MDNNFFNGEWYSISEPPPVRECIWRDRYGDEHSDFISDDVILYDNVLEEYKIGRYHDNNVTWEIGDFFYSVDSAKKDDFTYWTYFPKPPKGGINDDY